MEVSGLRAGRNGELLLNGYIFMFRVIKKALKVDNGYGCPAL